MGEEGGRIVAWCVRQEGVDHAGVEIEKVVCAKLFRGRGKVGVIIVPAMTAGIKNTRTGPDPYYYSWL
jgi:hypothetical protein